MDRTMSHDECTLKRLKVPSAKVASIGLHRVVREFLVNDYFTEKYRSLLRPLGLTLRLTPTDAGAPPRPSADST